MVLGGGARNGLILLDVHIWQRRGVLGVLVGRERLRRRLLLLLLLLRRRRRLLCRGAACGGRRCDRLRHGGRDVRPNGRRRRMMRRLLVVLLLAVLGRGCGVWPVVHSACEGEGECVRAEDGGWAGVTVACKSCAVWWRRVKCSASGLARFAGGVVGTRPGAVQTAVLLWPGRRPSQQHQGVWASGSSGRGACFSTLRAQQR